MEFISHRGNIDCPNQNENCPFQIEKAIKLFRVEIDVWFIGGKWFLGHDRPTYEIGIGFFDKDMFLHCKNFEAVKNLSDTCYNWFWHEKDAMTLTSKGEIWCYPENYVENGITVVKKEYSLELKNKIPLNIKGICTDYPLIFKEKIYGF
tara:strand:- start:145 stop:591 length:447 start_codon:yes stop_codon:yes gene_type:complete